MSSERFSRHSGLFSEDVQAKISTSKIGIVGLGGLGSHIVQGLTYLGVKSYVLIDDDQIEMSNLNRLIGGAYQDVIQRKYKVDIAHRLILSVNPEAEVIECRQNLRSKEALNLLSDCDFIFGCIDNDGARQILMELSSASNIIYFDLGTQIIKNDDYYDYGGRLVISIPGEYCLLCANELDMAEAKYHLLPKKYQMISENHGYGLGATNPAPSVAFLNGILANLAIQQFVSLIAGSDKLELHLRYYGSRLKISRRVVKRKLDCFTCDFIFKQGSEFNIGQYAIT